MTECYGGQEKNVRKHGRSGVSETELHGRTATVPRKESASRMDRAFGPKASQRGFVATNGGRHSIGRGRRRTGSQELFVKERNQKETAMPVCDAEPRKLGIGCCHVAMRSVAIRGGAFELRCCCGSSTLAVPCCRAMSTTSPAPFFPSDGWEKYAVQSCKLF